MAKRKYRLDSVPNKLAEGYVTANKCVCASCCAVQPERKQLKEHVLGVLRNGNHKCSFMATDALNDGEILSWNQRKSLDITYRAARAAAQRAQYHAKKAAHGV